ncbi:MAG: RusA family crossover junction endodeoxyribonuclease [Prolixibacteraceae bacterium]|nr:RusA family crossover junction endodeoxyribonuclease [Prolixibacteraceae bacterium]
MASYFSFIGKNIEPLSQNKRHSRLMMPYQGQLARAFFTKYKIKLPLAKGVLLDETKILHGKVFYIHKVKDKKDADNISKPLWDALQEIGFYKNDNQILHIQAVKIDAKKLENEILSFDLTDVKDPDFSELVYFILDPANSNKRLLYIRISDFESENVKF